jgi:hypothetical protein
LHPLDTLAVVDDLVPFSYLVARSQFSTVSVIRVFAQTDVARDDDVGELFPDEFRREDDWSLRVVGGRTSVVFVHVEGNSEEDDGLQSFLDEGSEERFELVESPTFLTWERDDLDLRGESLFSEAQRVGAKAGGSRWLTSASGSSVMNMGYMSISLVKCRSAWRLRKSGLKYPP